MNKYEKWYKQLCDRGLTRLTDEYTEKHHIVPESFFRHRKRKGSKGWLEGNCDCPSNITRLTDREHELAHYLLTKIYKHDKRSYLKVLKAYEMRSLVNQNQGDKRHFCSRRLAGIRAERARLQSELMRGENNPMYGKSHTAEARDTIKQKNTGRKHTPQELENQRVGFERRKALGIKRKGYDDEYRADRSQKYTGEGNPNFGNKHTVDSKIKIGDANRGRKQTEEEKKRRGDSNRGKVREKKYCEWCSIDCAVNTFPRFHGDNCHLNPTSPRYNPNKKIR